MEEGREPFARLSFFYQFFPSNKWRTELKKLDGMQTLMSFLVPGKILPDEECIAHIAKVSGSTPEMIEKILFGDLPNKPEGIGFGAPALD